MSEVQLTPETKAFTITLQYNFAGEFLNSKPNQGKALIQTRL